MMLTDPLTTPAASLIMIRKEFDSTDNLAIWIFELIRGPEKFNFLQVKLNIILK